MWHRTCRWRHWPRGLGREGEHTSRTLIRMTVVDWLVMIVVTLPLALDIAGVI